MSPLLLTLFIPSHCLLRSISTGLWLTCEPESVSAHYPHPEQTPKSFLQPTRPCDECPSPPHPLLLPFSPILTLCQLHSSSLLSDTPSTSGAPYGLFSSPGTFLPHILVWRLHPLREALPDLVYRTLLVLLSSWGCWKLY